MQVTNAFRPFGYDPLVSFNPGQWFQDQNTTTELAIVQSICQSMPVFQIKVIYKSLKSDVTLANNVTEKFDICINAASLSQQSKPDPAILSWLVTQDLTVQESVVDKICSAWVNGPQAIQQFAKITSATTGLSNDILEYMDQCPPMQAYKSNFQSHFDVYIGLLVSTLVLLVGFIVFITGFEIPNADKELSFKSVATPFNVSLLVGFLAIILYDAMFALFVRQAVLDMRTGYGATGSLWFSTNPVRNVAYMMKDLFQFIWALSYLFFSWRRSQLQVQRILPKSFHIIKNIFLFSPVLIMSPMVLSIYQIVHPTTGLGTQFNYWFEAASAIAFLGFDSLFLYCFMRFLIRTRMDKSTPFEPKFLIISRYGVAGCIPCLSVGALNLFLACTGTGADYSYLSFYTLLISLCIHLVLFLTVAMKVALYVQAMKDVREFHSRGRPTVGKTVTADSLVRIGSAIKGSVTSPFASRIRPSENSVMTVGAVSVVGGGKNTSELRSTVSELRPSELRAVVEVPVQGSGGGPGASGLVVPTQGSVRHADIEGQHKKGVDDAHSPPKRTKSQVYEVLSYYIDE
ncbi:hypothetical protein HDU98_010503 [Podochytrium sp. JEL0797]|nr:hypothetical protein HDU98_010503 [Podochytrium sp. JEL0797]